MNPTTAACGVDAGDAEALYRESQPKPPGGGGEAGGRGNGRTKTAEGEVVDAEFEDLGPKN